MKFLAAAIVSCVLVVGSWIVGPSEPRSYQARAHQTALVPVSGPSEAFMDLAPPTLPPPTTAPPEPEPLPVVTQPPPVTQAPRPPETTRPPQPAPVASGGDCGNVHWAAAYIYMRESGCNPAAVNPGGCRGIGQACPGSKLPCGNDFACQHEWFTGYAMSRYGSWEAAYQFWLANHWW